MYSTLQLFHTAPRPVLMPQPRRHAFVRVRVRVRVKVRVRVRARLKVRVKVEPTQPPEGVPPENP